MVKRVTRRRLRSALRLEAVLLHVAVALSCGLAAGWLAKDGLADEALTVQAVLLGIFVVYPTAAVVSWMLNKRGPPRRGG